MKKTRVILLSLLLISIIGYSTYYYIWNCGARDLSTEKTDFTLSSITILNEFTTNQDSSNKKYLEKAVAVSGTITTVSANEIIVDNSIICSLKNPDSSLIKGEGVTVKGRVVGYDDLMGELKLDQCFVTKN